MHSHNQPMKRRLFARVAPGGVALLCLFLALRPLMSQPREPVPPTTTPLLPEGVAPEGGARTHDPSTIMRDGNRYWVFHTGRGGPSKFSTDLRHWTMGPKIFAEPPAWWREAVPENKGDLWAPDIIRLGQRFALYYSVSSFGKNTSAIGLATNVTLDPSRPDYKWRDEGIILQSSQTDDFNAIDPALIRDEKQQLWLSFGSFWSGIKLVELDAQSGKRLTGAPLYSIAAPPPGTPAIEAPYLFRQGNYFYLFVNWGFCCRGINSTYEVRLGRSRTVTGPYLDKEGRDLNQGGGSLFLARQGRFIGPGHIGILPDNDTSWCSYHFYDENNEGRPALMIRRLFGGEQSWPVLQEATIIANP